MLLGETESTMLLHHLHKDEIYEIRKTTKIGQAGAKYANTEMVQV
jgi:hypothetical protein